MAETPSGRSVEGASAAITIDVEGTVRASVDAVPGETFTVVATLHPGERAGEGERATARVTVITWTFGDA